VGLVLGRGTAKRWIRLIRPLLIVSHVPAGDRRALRDASSRLAVSSVTPPVVSVPLPLGMAPYAYRLGTAWPILKEYQILYLALIMTQDLAA
jgi:hypothetical protein